MKSLLFTDHTREELRELVPSLIDLVRSLAIGGFQRIFLLNGHGGNHEIIQLVARNMALRHSIQIDTGDADPKGQYGPYRVYQSNLAEGTGSKANGTA